MGRENKKEAVAALHRQKILEAAKTLFTEKGFAQTTIDDISSGAGYSRRTIYAYFESKEDILHHIMERGLIQLKKELQHAVSQDSAGFGERFLDICYAMKRYQFQCPQSAEQVVRGNTTDLAGETLTPALKRVLDLGTEINQMLAGFLEEGRAEGALRSDVKTLPAVYILWSSVSGLLTLVQTKGGFLTRSLAMTEEEFLEYGFRQILHSILEERL